MGGRNAAFFLIKNERINMKFGEAKFKAKRVNDVLQIWMIPSTQKTIGIVIRSMQFNQANLKYCRDEYHCDNIIGLPDGNLNVILENN